MRYLTALILYALSTASAHAAPPQNLIDGLNARTPKEQAYAAWALHHYAQELEPAVLERLVDMLDSQRRVVLQQPNNPQTKTPAKKHATTPGDEASNTLLAANTQAINPLSIALLESRMTIRWRAAHILGKIKSPRCISPLLNAMRDDQNKLVKLTASEALTQIGKLAVPQLIEILELGSQEERAQAIWSLSEINDERAIPHLVRTVMNSKTQNAALAINALQKMGDTSADIFTQLLLSPETSLEAKMRACVAASKVTNTNLKRALITIILTQQNEQLRLHALHALSAHNDPLYADLLINIIRDLSEKISNTSKQIIAQQNPQAASIYTGYLRLNEKNVQDMAFDCLALLGKKAQRPLLTLLKDPSYPLKIRQRAGVLLQRAGLQKVSKQDLLTIHYTMRDWTGMSVYGKVLTDGHLARLNDPDPEIRSGALLLLGELEKTKLLPHFIAALKDPNDNVRDTAEIAIARLGRSTFPELLNELDRSVSLDSSILGNILKEKGYLPKTDYEKVKYHAALNEWRPLDRLGQSAIAYLIEELKNKNSHTTAWAAWTLARHQEFYPLSKYDIGAFDPLLESILKTEKTQAFKGAHKTLRLQKGHTSVAYLLVPLLAKKETLRQEATQSLALIGKEALPALQPLLQSSLDSVIDPAIQVLNNMGEPALPTLLNLLKNDRLHTKIIPVLEDLQYNPATVTEKLNYLRATQDFEGLVRIGPAGVKIVVDFCNRDDAEKFPEAFRALGKAENTALISVLMTGMAHPSKRVKIASHLAILEMGEKTAPLLLNYAWAGNLQYANIAAKTLNSIPFEPPSDSDALWLRSVSQDWKAMIEKKTEVEALLGSLVLDPDNNRRMIANSMLAGLREIISFSGGKEKEKLLRNVAQNLQSNNPNKRASAAILLSQKGVNFVQLIPVLSKLLQDNTVLVARNGEPEETPFGLRTPGLEAAKALGAMGSPSVPTILKALESEDITTKENAEIAASSIVNTALINHQIQLLKDERIGVAIQSAQTLGEGQAQQATSALINALDRQNNPLNRTIEDALNKLGSNIVAEISTALQKPDAIESRNIILISVLTSLGGENAAKAIILFSKTTSKKAKRTLYRSLALIGTPHAIKHLISELQDPSWALRESASKALIYIGKNSVPELIIALEQAIKKEKKRPTEEMVSILKRITNKDFGSDTTAWNTWWDSPQK